ncbi:TPA: hypothetical protein N0F65_001967 [Lagenidium giganteum]|uniref:Uncharacterized protein n=1 Tax=Lagenidium giganteum TaxID=4803 RepID=A0AAV2YQH7_9STRA|nr:TPA: hypothetical protein N0F65_001967 [Lagenidium giganteum]
MEKAGGMVIDVNEPVDGMGNDDEVNDGRRNWTPAVTLELARAWRRVVEANGNVMHHVLLDRVHAELRRSVDCTNRSKKSIEGKLYGLKRMYLFIADFNANRKKTPAGGKLSGKTWFELSREEQRKIRGLNNIKDPKITVEVFSELDKFLNGKRSRKKFVRLPSEDEDFSTPTARSGAGNDIDATYGSDRPVDEAISPAGDVVDHGRNWRNDVALELIRVWSDVERQHKNLHGSRLRQRVYEQFTETVQNSSRSRKAVEDKMHCMKEMHRIITLYNQKRLHNGPSWFELSREEQRKYRASQNVKYSNISEEVFNMLDQFLGPRYLRRASDDDSSLSSDMEDSEDDEAPVVVRAPAENGSSTTQRAAGSNNGGSMVKKRRIETARGDRYHDQPRVDLLVPHLEEQTNRVLQHMDLIHHRETEQRDRHHMERMAVLHAILNSLQQQPAP